MLTERVIEEKEIQQFLTGMAKSIPESEIFCRVMAEVSQYPGVSWTKAGENFGWALANYDLDPTRGEYYPVLTRESLYALVRPKEGKSTFKKRVYKDYDLSLDDDEPIHLGKIWFQELLADILTPSD